MNPRPIIYDRYNRPVRSQVRNFDGAKGTRYTADWLATSGPGDKFLRQDVKTLRERARDLERNEGYAESLFIEVESNVIGPSGIKLKPMARKADGRNKGGLANKIDADACAKIANFWEDVSKRGKFDVTRQFSRPAFERIAVRSIVRDGGFLVRHVEGIAKTPYRYMVQGMEVDALDPQYNDSKKRISMSVEFDEWDEPINYHLRKTDPKTYQWSGLEDRQAVSAEQMIHLFMSRRINQSQGFSWLAPVMTRLRHLGKYEESEVIAARGGANKVGFFEVDPASDGYKGDEDERGNIVAPSSPGEWEVLPAGVKPHFIDPSHPNANYPDFRKAILRGVCAGIYVNYNTLAKDLEGVSYSSIRQGVLSERDIWRMIQSWFIDEFEAPIFERALKMALMAGQIDGLSILDYDRLCHAEFNGRTWAWVDPLNDVETAAREIEIGINSRQRIARDRGNDFQKITAENEADVETLEKAGLPTTTKPPANPMDKGARQFETLKAKFDAYGVGVRAGSITPQKADEDAFRLESGLPEMGPEAEGAWVEDKGVRRPITLQSQAAFEAAQDAVADEPKSKEAGEKQA
jgi:lambda family phage portal protein